MYWILGACLLASRSRQGMRTTGEEAKDERGVSRELTRSQVVGESARGAQGEAE